MSSGNRMTIAIAIVAILVVALLAVVLLGQNNNSEGRPATVVDASGTSVSLESAPDRIVSGAPDISEILGGLGLMDKVVAVTDYCDYPEEAAALRDAGATIGGFYTPSYEKVVSYDPDLVILSNSVQAQIDLASQLRNSGHTVLLVKAATNLSAVFENIDMIGKITGKQAEANDIVAEMRNKISLINTKVSEEERPTIMFVTYADAGFTNVWPAGGGTAIDEIIDLAGGENAFSEMNGFEMASNEVLMTKAANVDCIVMTIMFSPETPQNTSAWFKNDALWKESPAVKNNNVYFLTGQGENIFNRESVRTVDAVQIMAEILHPGAFSSQVPHTADGVNIIGDEYEVYLTSGTGSQVTSSAVSAAGGRE